MVLEQPVGHDHVRADELLVPGELVPDDRAVVDDHLEVQASIRTQALHRQQVAWAMSRRRRRKAK